MSKETTLRYIGPEPGVSALPLPEGWPATDHDEPDEALRKEKLASRMYTAPSAAAAAAAAKKE